MLGDCFTDMCGWDWVRGGGGGGGGASTSERLRGEGIFWGI
jgi:hypothetical protein